MDRYSVGRGKSNLEASLTEWLRIRWPRQRCGCPCGVSGNRAVRQGIRLTLGLLRWPIGVVAFAGLPAAVRGLMALGQSLDIDVVPLDCHHRHGGPVVQLVAPRAMGRFITTIEHEALHAIVAMLTLIPVEMKVREDGSGHPLFQPPGHWLLFLAPYFIPMLLLAEIALVRMLGLPSMWEMALFGLLLGVSLAGHLRQLHPRQTDFRMAGRVFTIAFLPTAFLLGYGIALSFIAGSDWALPPGSSKRGPWTDGRMRSGHSRPSCRGPKPCAVNLPACGLLSNG